jgi:hypothetical protein
MPLMWKTETLYMRWRLACHEAPARHLQPRSEVFVMKDHAGSSPARGLELAKAYGIRPAAQLNDCSTCHR